MILPTDSASLAVLVRHHIDPASDDHTRLSQTTEALQSAGLIRWTGAPRQPGWAPTETGAALINQNRSTP